MEFHFTSDDVKSMSKEQLMQLVMIQQHIINQNRALIASKQESPPRKKPVPIPKRIRKTTPYQFKLMNTAFKNYDRSYNMVLNDNTITDPYMFIETDGSKSLRNIIRSNFREFGPVKIFCTAHIEFIKVWEKITVTDSPYFNSKVKTVYNKESINSVVDEIVDEINYHISMFEREGSNWLFNKFLGFYANFSNFNPLRGSSYIDLPYALKTKKAIINIKNKDDMCFKWSILAKLHPVDVHPERVSHYKKFSDELNFENIENPVSLEDIHKFEKLNNISVNVFGYNNEEVYPLYITKSKHNEHVPKVY